MFACEYNLPPYSYERLDDEWKRTHTFPETLPNINEDASQFPSPFPVPSSLTLTQLKNRDGIPTPTPPPPTNTPHISIIPTLITFNPILNDQEIKYLEIVNDGQTSVIVQLLPYSSPSSFLYPTEAFCIVPNEKKTIPFLFSTASPGVEYYPFFFFFFAFVWRNVTDGNGTQSFHQVVHFKTEPFIEGLSLDLHATCILMDEDSVYREKLVKKLKREQFGAYFLLHEPKINHLFL